MDAKIFQANCLSSCSIYSRTSHMDLERLANNFGPIMKLFRASSIFSPQTPIKFRHFTSVFSKEIVLVFTASSASGIMRNSFPLINSSYTFFLQFYVARIVFFACFPSFQWLNPLHHTWVFGSNPHDNAGTIRTVIQNSDKI